MSFVNLREQVTRYYTSKVEEHGATARGVDWSSPDSQALRFAQLLKVCGDEPGSLLDYGCGYGALLGYMDAHDIGLECRGFDCAASMIAHAVAAASRPAAGDLLCDESLLTRADYVVASGLLNVKLDASDEEWQAYMTSIGRAPRVAQPARLCVQCPVALFRCRQAPTAPSLRGSALVVRPLQASDLHDRLPCFTTIPCTEFTLLVRH